MPSERRNHPIFKKYPVRGSTTLWCGEVTKPYTIYDGGGVFIGGTADLISVRQLLRGEHMTPIATQDRRALMGVWICDFTESNLGAHHELQISFFVSEKQFGEVPAHPLALVKLMSLEPNLRMMCHGLWNNTDRVVAFNEELLALPARRAKSMIKADGAIVFSFDEIDVSGPDKLILRGQLKDAKRNTLDAAFKLTQLIGVSKMNEISKRPMIELSVVNPVCGRMPRNAEAQTFSANDSNALRIWDAKTDRLLWGDVPYHDLDFQPDYVQIFRGARFVYLEPR
jgi:hypothetical protein